MKKLNLSSRIRLKRKYSSYKGTLSRIADNLIKRDFKASKPNKKYNQEVIAHDISKSPNFDQINRMLDQAFKNGISLKGLCFHSDQGWQYQHEKYQQALIEREINQSMSRKGNSLDNALMENFFGILKSEMFYGLKRDYDSLESLIIGIDDYIHYYNRDRIKVKLNGLSPVIYRTQSIN
jgi:putative transposase